ncbi:MIF4G domain-containing protein A [Orchesella cincta]|uniref:MIF4G domain-containing protein A n=1 Tax=Orchesella cincta TaxID=48709 RepID=A0A1D2MKJ2_ORCCI|nr:MIF4G domain-containing protein A [Orchesella cincta]
MRKGGGTGLYGSGPGGGLPLHHPAHQRNGGRIFVQSHQGGQMGPYNHNQHQQQQLHHHHAAAAALHQSGLALLHHPGAHPQPQQPNHHNPHPNHRHFNGPTGPTSSQFQGGGGGAGGGLGEVVQVVLKIVLDSSRNPILLREFNLIRLEEGVGVGEEGWWFTRNKSRGDWRSGWEWRRRHATVETVVARLETACRLLHGIGGNNTRVNEISSEIQILSEDLRRVGSMLENTYPEVLDRVMSSMRDASAQPCLPPSLRLAIFELVELRASKWMLPSDSSNYYRQRRNLNDATDGVEERRPGGGGGGVNINVVVTSCAPGGTSPIKPEPIFPPGSSPPSSASVMSSMVAETPAKTYREEIVIKNSDSGKVAPTAKERVLSINGYSQQSINLAKQLIQETITRNASPVLEGMVLPSSATSLSGDYPDLDDSDLVGMSGSLKRLQLQSSSSSSQIGGISKLSSSDPHSQHHHPSHHQPSSSHFTYTVTLGDHSIKILGDDIQYVQEAKMALDDYFLQKYPDLFCAASIEDEEEDDEDGQLLEGDENDPSSFNYQRYDRDTLLSLSGVQTPSPDFSHLEPEVRGSIVLEKRRDFDLEKFNGTGSAATSGLSAKGPSSSSTTSDILPG